MIYIVKYRYQRLCIRKHSYQPMADYDYDYYYYYYYYDDDDDDDDDDELYSQDR